MDITDSLSDSDERRGHDIDLLPPEVFKRFQCALCGKRYVDKRNFTSHVDAHTGVTYTCKECPNRKFTNTQSFRRHTDWHKNGSVYLICATCGVKFEEKYQLASHKLTHGPALLPCPVDAKCGQTFKHKGDQQRHGKYAHRKTKDFECSNCNKFFQSPQSRSAHLKSCIN